MESDPERFLGKSLEIAFWDKGEFLAFVEIRKQPDDETVVWVPNSYSKAWYQLALVAAEEKNFDRALFHLDYALELEADHPALWNERGHVLQQLHRFEDALTSYVRAETVRSWASPLVLARALRGQGSSLIDRLVREALSLYVNCPSAMRAAIEQKIERSLIRCPLFSHSEFSCT